MKDVTPKSDLQLILKCIGSAIGVVILIAFFKIAIDAFLEVSWMILPIALVFYLTIKFGGRR